MKSKMKGKRKYKCGNCGDIAFYHWIHLNRASGLKCVACGSRNISAVSSDAIKDAAEKQAVRVSGGTPCTTLPLEKSHTKVV